MNNKRILIVEDEVPIRDMIKFALNPNEFKTFEAENTQEAFKQIYNEKPDLILLDWMLPGQSGIEFVKQIKKNKNTLYIPIIMLTARAEEENKIKGLEVGVDDYITKPFSPKELVLRIKTILRRGLLITTEGIIEAKKIIIDSNSHQVTINNENVPLTANEYKLLYFLVTHEERIFTREQLLDQVWGNQQDINERSVDVQVQRLRSRLAPFNCAEYIKTIRGYGYQFNTRVR